MRNKKVDLLKGPIIEAIIYLMIPILISGLFQQAYNLADTYVMKLFVGDDGIAIIGGIPRNLVNIFTGIITACITASLITVAYQYGSANYQKITSTIKTAFVFCLAITLIFMAIYFFFTNQLCDLLKIPENVFDDNVSYIRLYLLSYIPYTISQLSINILRGLGETKSPTRLLIGSYIMIVIFDFVFVGFFKLQQSGVALSYTVSQSITALLGLYELYKITNVNLIKDKFDFDSFKRIIKIAIPACASSVMFSFTTTYIQTIINTMGLNVVTGYAIYNKIESFLWVILDGYAVALATLISQNYGAKQYHRIRQIVIKGSITGIIASGFISLVVVLFRQPLASIFTSDLNTIEIIKKMSIVMGSFYVAYPIIDVMQAELKCVGKATQSTIIIVVTVCLYRTIYAYFASKTNSYALLTFVFPSSWIFSTITFLIYYNLVKNKDLPKE